MSFKNITPEEFQRLINRCILERALPRARASPCAFAQTLIIVETHLGK